MILLQSYHALADSSNRRSATSKFFHSTTLVGEVHRYFEVSAYWKNTRKEMIINLLSMWFSDENAFIRQEMTAEALTHTSRLLEPMIRQGIEEKVFTTRFPADAALITTGVFLNLGGTIVMRLLAPDRSPAPIEVLWPILDAYVDAIERILGAPSGSLEIAKAGALKDWTISQPNA